MRRTHLSFVWLLTLFSLPSISCAQRTATTTSPVTLPQAHLNRPVGGDFTLADWNEVAGYYHKLAEQSPRVRVSVAGKTTEGRDFLVATISSEANLKNLDQLKQHARTIADPRNKSPEQKEAALRDGKVFLVITPSMHSTEVAATQLLLSGYIAKPDTIAGHSAWLRVEHGKGRAHLFGFQPHYRAWTQATFPLIFRAAFLDAERPDP